MCGFVALFHPTLDGRDALQPALRVLRPRGPDGEGCWQEAGVSLGHRRLAVLDPDPRAAQPMASSCGRYVVVFNGEIYNFRELRLQLERSGEAFRTGSDTEVILALFAREGAAMLPRLHGMFAFIIHDRVTGRAFAARDPYGIKPLYVARIAGGIAMGSQVRALLATGLVDRAPDPRGQAGFWMLGSVPEPHTWYRDIQALPAGHCAWIEHARMQAPRPWCDIGDAWRDAALHVAARVPDVRGHVREALRESVRRHLVSDVPFGVFLSGGIDSGALAALMAQAAGPGFVGVTIAYDEFAGRREDEVPAATQVAARLGIRHHVRHVTCAEFQADLPRILAAMDQPSIDGVNTWYASKAVAELGLKVVVSGVGGDELFQGYASFRELPSRVRQWRMLAALPGVRRAGAMLGAAQAARSGNARWRHAAEWLQTIAGAWWLRRSVRAPGDLAALMGPEQAAAVVHDFDVAEWVQSMAGDLAADPRLALGQLESCGYLRNQLLRDADWASMDHGVELRTPLVDARLLATLAPVLAQFAEHPHKRLLAEAPSPALPRSVRARRKTGFGIPLGRWQAQSGRDDAMQRSWGQRVADGYGGAPA